MGLRMPRSEDGNLHLIRMAVLPKEAAKLKNVGQKTKTMKLSVIWKADPVKYLAKTMFGNTVYKINIKLYEGVLKK